MFTRRLATYIEHKKMGGGEGESTSSIKNQQLHHPIVTQCICPGVSAGTRVVYLEELS